MFLKCLCEFCGRNCPQHHGSTALESTHEPLQKEKWSVCFLSWAERGVGHKAWLLFLRFGGLNLFFLGSQKLTSYSRRNNFENLSCLLFIVLFVISTYLYTCIFNSENFHFIFYNFLEKIYCFILYLV